MQRYVDQTGFLALITLGGVSKAELRKLPDVHEEAIQATYNLLKEKGWEQGQCERCDLTGWVKRVTWETEKARFNAKLCMKCGQICQPPGRAHK